jgi:hypothetical protein
VCLGTLCFAVLWATIPVLGIRGFIIRGVDGIRRRMGGHVEEEMGKGGE